jgi:hypothetical protein
MKLMKNSRSLTHRPPAAAMRLALGAGLVALAGSALPSLSASPSLADISVHIGVDAPPPPPRREVVVERDRPGPGYVWVGGFWDGAPGHYVWRAGHWDRPPHGHGVWAPPHWERDHDGHYHQVRGEWRDR